MYVSLVGRISKTMLTSGMSIVTAIAILVAPLSGTAHSPAVPVGANDSPELDCAGVFYPIDLTIEPHAPAIPGGVATATVQVSVDRTMGAVELECRPAPELEWLSQPLLLSIERLAPGEVYERELAVRLPASLDRRVVEVTVRGWMNGAPLQRSTIWNLIPGGAEESREVTRSDGSRVREVAARWIR